MIVVSFASIPANAYDTLKLFNPSSSFSNAAAINNSGQAAVYYMPGLSYAYSWNGNTTTSLGIGEALAINNLGQVVGVNVTAGNLQQAVLWNSGSTSPTVLGSIGGLSSGALSINDSGQIVGYSGDNAVVWNNGSTTPTNLGSGGARGINNSGQIVGNSNGNAVVWNNGSTTPTILGSGAAEGINNLGQIVGTSVNNAVIWNGGTPTILGGLGGTWSIANAINDLGQAVGLSTYPNSYAHVNATLWDGSNVIDLNSLIDPSLGFTLVVASGINNAGQIVGYGINALGNSQAFMLTLASPVPEIKVNLMLLIGLCLFGFMVRKREAS